MKRQAADKALDKRLGFVIFIGQPINFLRLMLRHTPTQHALEMVTLEQLVPADHLVCKIDAVIDFDFIQHSV